jgi:hypothetical protein
VGYVIKGLFSGLTPAEKWFLITHPHLIDDISELADIALAESRRRFPGAGQHNGNGDAFRHCYWSALLARDIGASNARDFTTAHEAYSDNPPGERAMDLHNNGIGIGLGTGSSETNEQLSNRCAAELTAGTLLTAPPTPGAAY